MRVTLTTSQSDHRANEVMHIKYLAETLEPSKPQLTDRDYLLMSSVAPSIYLEEM